MMKLNLNHTELRVSAGFPSQFPHRPLPQVAFAGRSNVGKSSLVNALLGRKSLARVSASPGKTITVNFYEIDGKLFFVDLPGYGYAKRTYEEQKRWSALTDGFFTSNPDIGALKLVLLLVDSRIGPTEDDRDMLRYLAECRLPFAVVATKADKLTKTEAAALTNTLRSDPLISGADTVILHSSKTGLGSNDIWNAICDRCNIH